MSSQLHTNYATDEQLRISEAERDAARRTVAAWCYRHDVSAADVLVLYDELGIA